MATYNGNIGLHFLKAEINFEVSLPSYCENQAFELYEVIDEEDVLVMEFSLILNNRENIVSTEEGTVYYTGEIFLTEAETQLIAQVKIEKSEVPTFSERKFTLKVF
jgi:hypothetical protein